MYPFVEMRRNTISMIKFACLCMVFVTIPFSISFMLNFFFPIEDYPIDYMHQEENLSDSDLLGFGGNQRIDLNEYVNHDSHADQFDPRVYMTSVKTVATNAAEQTLVDTIAESLQIKYEVLSNYEALWLFTAKLTLTNTGSVPFTKSGWSIYMFHLSFVEQKAIKESHSALVYDGQFNVSHIDGSLYKFTPTSLYQEISPGEARDITLANGGSMVSKSGIFPNWYVASTDTEPRIITSTEGDSMDFVGDFGRPSQWKRNEADLYDPFSPDKRYVINADAHDYGQAKKLVIPTPLNMTIIGGVIELKVGDWGIVCSPELKMEANILSGQLEIPIKDSLPTSNFIHLSIGSIPMPTSHTTRLNLDEAYTIQTSPDNLVIDIRGASPAGVFYGIQTLLSVHHHNRKEIMAIEVTDAPRFGYRGLMVDVARNFFPMYEIIRVIDGMAMYKLNTLHLHLSDDQGWRLEIPGLEELTRIGSKRGHNFTVGLAVPPAVGSGPFEDVPGSGFYSVQEYRMILRHARSRHIDVIPEFDTPGHSGAAMISMEARYRRLRGDNMEEALKYRLVDPEDTSEYYAPEAHRWSTLNPCMDSSYLFVEHVMAAVKAMHQDIMPLRVYHMGGDEVPEDALKKSPICQEFQRSHAQYNTTAQLVNYFIQRVARIAQKHHLKLQMWEDGALDDDMKPFNLSQFPVSEVTCNVWNTLWEFKRGHRTAMFANDGYKVILSPATHLYFDHPQEPDPEERGLHWARRYIDARKTFSFQPEHVYDNMDEEKFGRPIIKEEACSLEGYVDCIPITRPDNIIGMQGHLWSELIRTQEHLETMLYPRLLALAERSWHRASWEGIPDEKVRERLRLEDWESFANTLGHKELSRLEAEKIMYYLPPPGALVMSGEIKANTAFPGLIIQYSIDVGNTWSDLQPGFKFDVGQILLATRSFNLLRRGRAIKVNIT